MTFSISTELLDACVLAVLRTKDTYGYSLTQALKEVIDISDSTLYPVLRRLTKSGLLETYDQPYEGRNRRYYSLTPEGEQALGDYILAWESYKAQIDTIFEGGVTVD